MLGRRHVTEMLNTRAGTPVAARNLLRCLRVLIRYAADIGLRADDPNARHQSSHAEERRFPHMERGRYRGIRDPLPHRLQAETGTRITAAHRTTTRRRGEGRVANTFATACFPCASRRPGRYLQFR